jgi:predicted nucleic acid-binding Zn ribbon protein
MLLDVERWNVRSRGTDPKPLSAAMDSLVRSLQGGTRRAGAAAVGGVFGHWADVVGVAMAAHVQPVKLEGDRLVVEVQEPAWATEVRMLTDRIIDRVAEVAGITIAAIDVRVAGARGRVPRRESGGGPTSP